MRRGLILLFLVNLFCIPVYAANFDTSIDDDIRRNYNPSKIEQDLALPALPNIINEQSENNYVPAKATVQTKSAQIQTKPAVAKTVKQNTVQLKPIANQYNAQVESQSYPLTFQPKISTPIPGGYITLKKGTKIRAKLVASLSDKARRGTKVTFVSKYPVSTTYFTIPMGTTFEGEVVYSHRPQFIGNGGLVVVNVNSVIINGQPRPITGVVTEVNFKNVYFNNLKGKNRYLKGMKKSMKYGAHFFKKMCTVSKTLATDGSSIVVAPFAIVSGVAAVGANAIVSPVLGMFYKGDSLYIKGGSDFEIKLMKDAVIYN